MICVVETQRGQKASPGGACGIQQHQWCLIDIAILYLSTLCKLRKWQWNTTAFHCGIWRRARKLDEGVWSVRTCHWGRRRCHWSSRRRCWEKRSLYWDDFKAFPVLFITDPS